MRKAENISSAFLFLSLITYLTSYFLWGVFSDKLVEKIYWISMYNVLMFSGVAVMTASKSNLLHFLGTGMFCVFSWMLTLEFMGDPTKWTKFNIATFFIDGFISIFIGIKLLKVKNNLA